jgi:hypothetical protein
VDDAWNDEDTAPETLPSHEQIGYLYLFAYYMNMRAEEISREASQIMGALRDSESSRPTFRSGERPVKSTDA